MALMERWLSRNKKFSFLSFSVTEMALIWKFMFSPTESHPLLDSVLTEMALIGQEDKEQSLIFETVSKLGFRERDLAVFYSNLIDSYSNHKPKLGFFDSYARLKELVYPPSSVYVKRRAFESMISGL
ncbi:Pentatricopeptide repeat-containing protein [Camellia lanceoleosa]|nr:Pentatricopeptide repeat-containing protein [Camellia lanceoleosa]